MLIDREVFNFQCSCFREGFSVGTEEEGKQRYLKGFFQSICLDYPDLFGQFAGEVMALMQ